MACRRLMHVLGSIAVRFAIPLLAALTAVALVACGGGDDETAAPVPLAQRSRHRLLLAPRRVGLTHRDEIEMRAIMARPLGYAI